MDFQEYNVVNSPTPDSVKRVGLGNEAYSLLQPVRLFSQAFSLTQAKRGNGQRIMLLPGIMTNALSMYPLKKYLSALGYSVEDWGLGINRGQVERYRDSLVKRFEDESDEQKITLIGWSLGGSVAREIARVIPAKVGSIITYGTPAIGGPAYTIGEAVWSKAETKRIHDLIQELDETNPIQVPISIMFTKKDSVVNWAACLDKKSINVKHYEVNSTHLSLGIDPSVWQIITNHLATYA